MTTHDIKCWPEHYQPMKAGIKRLELRLDDRGYEVEDILREHEWEPMTGRYTGDVTSVRVTHITRGGPWLHAGYVAMSIEVME